MTPEQEKAIADFATWANEERRDGVSLKTLHAAQANLADIITRHIAEDREHFARDGLWRAKYGEKIRRLEKIAGMRPSAPSINPDDSGAIDVHALGSGVTFRGPVPVKIAGALLVVLGLLGLGWGLRTAIAHGAVSAPPPITKEEGK